MLSLSYIAFLYIHGTLNHSCFVNFHRGIDGNMPLNSRRIICSRKLVIRTCNDTPFHEFSLYKIFHPSVDPYQLLYSDEVS